VYHITVVQTQAAHGKAGVTVDGAEQPDDTVPLIDDRVEHVVEVRIHRTKT
jgi:hypothetical protein